MPDEAVPNADSSAPKERKVIGRPFPPGVSGNPAGRPKGALSIRESIRKRLKENPHELNTMVEHFIKKNPELAWQMLEGRPSQRMDLDMDKEGIAELTDLFRAMAVAKPKENPNHGNSEAEGQ